MFHADVLCSFRTFRLVRGVQAIPIGVSGTMRLVLVVAFALGVRPRVSGAALREGGVVIVMIPYYE